MMKRNQKKDNWLKVTKSPWEFAQCQYYEVILKFKTKHEYEFYETSIFEDNKVICATFTQRITVRILSQPDTGWNGTLGFGMHGDSCVSYVISVTVWRAEYT